MAHTVEDGAKLSVGIYKIKGAVTAAAQVANPSPAETDAARARRICGDAWVTLALEQAWGRADPWLCNIRLYNNGSWSSYNQLLNAVRASGLGRYTFQVVPIGGSLGGNLVLRRGHRWPVRFPELVLGAPGRDGRLAVLGPDETTPSMPSPQAACSSRSSSGTSRSPRWTATASSPCAGWPSWSSGPWRSTWRSA